MRRPEFIARQARRPSGLLGKLLCRVMASGTAGENAMALNLLELQSDDQVLEIGFGPGRTLARAAELVPDGFAVGVRKSVAPMLDSRNTTSHEYLAEELASNNYDDIKKVTPILRKAFDLLRSRYPQPS